MATTLFPSIIPDDADGNDEDATQWEDRPAAAIEGGFCPWCDDYDGDSVAQHASSAHPDKWTAYTED